MMRISPWNVLSAMPSPQTPTHSAEHTEPQRMLNQQEQKNLPWVELVTLIGKDQRNPFEKIQVPESPDGWEIPKL